MVLFGTIIPQVPPFYCTAYLTIIKVAKQYISLEQMHLKLSALSCFVMQLNNKPRNPLPMDMTQNKSSATSILIDILK